MKLRDLSWLALSLAISACSDKQAQAPLEQQVEAIKKAEQVDKIVQDAAQQQQRDANQQ